MAFGAFPGDMPTMFGQMMTGRMDKGLGVLLAGYTYHGLNGATFGLMFTLLAGKVRWPWLFIVSFIAHVVFGVILGVLAERWVQDKGTLLALLRHDDVSLRQDLRQHPA